MAKKRDTRARYNEVIDALGLMTRLGWAFKPEVEALERELRKLAAVLFGPAPKLAMAKVRK